MFFSNGKLKLPPHKFVSWMLHNLEVMGFSRQNLLPILLYISRLTAVFVTVFENGYSIQLSRTSVIMM